jgi:hypothetical protein
MSTDNLYNRCRQRSHIGHQPEDNPLKQLESIGNYVSDLMVVCKQQNKGAAVAAGGAS